jgi:hypothetical protein
LFVILVLIIFVRGFVGVAVLLFRVGTKSVPTLPGSMKLMVYFQQQAANASKWLHARVFLL